MRARGLMGGQRTLVLHTPLELRNDGLAGEVVEEGLRVDRDLKKGERGRERVSMKFTLSAELRCVARRARTIAMVTQRAERRGQSRRKMVSHVSRVPTPICSARTA